MSIGSVIGCTVSETANSIINGKIIVRILNFFVLRSVTFAASSLNVALLILFVINKKIDLRTSAQLKVYGRSAAFSLTYLKH